MDVPFRLRAVGGKEVRRSMRLLKKFVNQMRKSEGFPCKLMMIGMNSGPTMLDDWDALRNKATFFFLQ